MNALTILGDWGTTRLRLYCMRDGQIVDRTEGPGIGALTEAPEAVLQRALTPWAAPGVRLGVQLCGMAGSRNGLVDVPYAECPANVAMWRARVVRRRFGEADVSIAAGLACENIAGAPDVMRGEETQVFGALALNPALAQGRRIIVLPGTHSKWVTVEDGVITSFQTYFTGELFSLLLKQSTLVRAGAEAGASALERDDGFDAGLNRAFSDPDLIGALFTARSAQLREARSVNWATGFLSGLLIGHEVRAAASERVVALTGAPDLIKWYARAFAQRDISCLPMDGEACVVAGLKLLAQELRR